MKERDYNKYIGKFVKVYNPNSGAETIFTIGKVLEIKSKKHSNGCPKLFIGNFFEIFKPWEGIEKVHIKRVSSLSSFEVLAYEAVIILNEGEFKFILNSAIEDYMLNPN
jgi:hypothetical protein